MTIKLKRRPCPFCADKGWQPIETAPKDGAVLLAWEPGFYQGKGGCALVTWFRGKWATVAASVSWDCHPSHWMPLPEPPEPKP